MTLVGQSIGEFAVLLFIGVALVTVTAALVTDFRSCTTRYVKRLRAWYDRPRWRQLHRTTEAQDRIGVRLAAGLGLAMGAFILAVEIAALASGHVV